MNYDGSEFEKGDGFEEAQVTPLSIGDPISAFQPSFYINYVKRFVDIAVILGSAPITVLVTFLMIVLVKRDGGSAFYGQDRIGKNGERFVCWKLRSMVSDADAKLEDHLASNPAARQEWNEFQKLRIDPRVTPIGRFLRRSSLDELPQLWCVLKGEMSIVGPRPFLPQQQSLYGGKIYYQMRPGITGLWQVSDHNDTNFAARVGFDDDYAQKASLWMDLKIMFKTVLVMARGGGR